jgi:hypothetical protein
MVFNVSEKYIKFVPNSKFALTLVGDGVGGRVGLWFMVYIVYIVSEKYIKSYQTASLHSP